MAARRRLANHAKSLKKTGFSPARAARPGVVFIVPGGPIGWLWKVCGGKEVGPGAKLYQ
jgi:hypothetical protein